MIDMPYPMPAAGFVCPAEGAEGILRDEQQISELVEALGHTSSPTDYARLDAGLRSYHSFFCSLTLSGYSSR